MDRDLQALKRSVEVDPGDEAARKRLIVALVNAGRLADAEQEALAMIGRRERRHSEDEIVCLPEVGRFEITVSYHNGGAACFAVSHQSGDWQMLWHEHPSVAEFEVPKLEQGSFDALNEENY